MRSKEEILFKAKRVDNGEWVEGGYAYTFNENKDFHIVGFMKEHHWIIEKDSNVVLIDYNTLCQYTGLTDKNGNKIWENDICHYHGIHEIHDDVCVIRYGEYDNNTRHSHIGFFTDWQAFDYLFRQDLGFWVAERELEIIGNIFDNPELLEGGAE